MEAQTIFFTYPRVPIRFLPIKGMPVYVDPIHSDGLENITYIASTSDLDETGDADFDPLSNQHRRQRPQKQQVNSPLAVIHSTSNAIENSIDGLQVISNGTRSVVQDTPVFADFYATDGFQFAVSGEVIYLGKSNGQLCQSLNGGDTWKDVTVRFTLFDLIEWSPKTRS